MGLFTEKQLSYISTIFVFGFNVRKQLIVKKYVNDIK
jgi:hypothetical protein